MLTTVAVLGATLAGVVGQAAARVRGVVAVGQAQLIGVALAVAARAQAAVAVLAASLTARLAGVVTVLTSATAAAVSRVQRGIGVIVGRITGLVDAIPLPDLPGVREIRARVVNVLSGAAAFVNERLGEVVGLVTAAGSTALAVVTSLVAGAVARARAVVVRMVAALMGLVRRAAALLVRLAASVARLLLRLLSATLFPLLRRIQRFVLGRIHRVLRLALRLLGLNRARQLASLAELARLRPLPRTRPGGPPADPDPETARDAARVVADAITNSTRVVRLFELVTGGALRAALAVVRGAVSRIRAEALRRAATLLTLVRAAVLAAVTVIRRLLAFVATMVAEILRAVATAVVRIVGTVRTLLNGAIDAVLATASGALTRIRDFLLGLVGRIPSGIAAVVRALVSLASNIRGFLTGGPNPVVAKGPIVRPPPAPIVIPILQGLLLFVFVVGYLVLAEFTFLAPVVTLLLALGLSEFAVVVVIGVVALLLLLLLLLLLVVLISTLWRRWRKPKKPVKRVIAVTPGAPEIGVGGRDLTVRALLAPGSPASPRLRWTINPGGTAPAGVVPIGTTSTVRVRAKHPPFGTVTGGAPITVRATLATNPGDFADSAGIMVVQVVEAHYTAAPPLAGVPPNSGPFPPNSVDPNRDGIGGSSAVVVSTTAPAGRAVLIKLRRSLGATAAGTTITPGTRTGDILVRVLDDPTGALLDERRPALVNPPILMSTLVVNAVPLRVSSLTFTNRHANGPYSAVNRIRFKPSDTRHPPLDRVVGELITGVRDDFNIPPPNGAFNPAFNPVLAVPASFWSDQLVTGALIAHAVDGRPAIDVNRFLGPLMPGLPRTLIYRQQMVWAAWRAGNVASTPIADGQHLRTLVRRGAGFGFTTHHTFPGVAPSKPPAEPYVGPPLIVLTRVVVTPTAAGATALAADGAATGNAVLTTTVPGRPVGWTVRSGDITVPAGNPSVPPGAATVRAGVGVGRFGLRAADTVHGNRQVDGKVQVLPVRLRGMRSSFAFGATSTVKVFADPGGRVVSWTLDPASVAAGVTVTPPTTGPGPARSTVTVTRPAGFRGTVVVTATDSVVATARASTTVRFRF